MSYGDENDDFNYSSITQEEFQTTLEDIVSKLSVDNLFEIPGIYEILAEEFNNEVLDICREKKETKS